MCFCNRSYWRMIVNKHQGVIFCYEVSIVSLRRSSELEGHTALRGSMKQKYIGRVQLTPLISVQL